MIQRPGPLCSQFLHNYVVGASIPLKPWKYAAALPNFIHKYKGKSFTRFNSFIRVGSMFTPSQCNDFYETLNIRNILNDFYKILYIRTYIHASSPNIHTLPAYGIFYVDRIRGHSFLFPLTRPTYSPSFEVKHIVVETE